MKDKIITNNLRPVFLFDNDDFYGLTLDLVLYNLNQPNSIKISTKLDSDRFFSDLKGKKYIHGIYIVDEYFTAINLINSELLKLIKANDPQSTLISYTVSDPTEVIDKELYDMYVLKSGLENSKSIIKVLSEILGIDFIVNNNEPENE